MDAPEAVGGQNLPALPGSAPAKGPAPPVRRFGLSFDADGNRVYPQPFWLRLPFRECMMFYREAMREAVMSNSVDATRRMLGEGDLFYLLTFILRRPDAIHPWVFERCREWQRAPDGHIDLWAREHYKSTVITFAGNIWSLILNPEETICIFSHTKPIAKKFLVQIKTEMEQNGDLWMLWPEIFWQDPKKESPKWSEDGGITVKRRSNPKEASIEATGLVDGQPTSRHYSLRDYDDVVTLESVSTPEQIQKVTHGFQMSDNLGARGGAIRVVGTRYHLFDTYATMIESGAFKLRVHPATADGTENGTPVLMARKELRHKRLVQGPYVFSSQMLLNPTADKAMGFNRNWLVHADTEPASAMQSLWRFILADPAGSKQRKGNDYTTMMVFGYGLDQHYRLLDMRRDRMNLTTRARTLIDLHKQWKPSLVAYEEYGMQADIEHIKHVQETELYKFDIMPLGGSMSKINRILRLVPLFENGYKSVEDGGDGQPRSRIILPHSLMQIDYQGRNRDLIRDFVEQEFVAFPVLAHDDMLDCMARILDLEALDAIQTPSPLAPPSHSYRDGYKGPASNQPPFSGGWITS